MSHLRGVLAGMADLASLLESARSRHGLIRTDELVAAGASPRTVARWVASGRFESVGHGVLRAGGAPPTFEGTVLAAVLVFDDETWASHRTAAALWGIPGFPADGRVELLRRIRLSNQRSAAVVHRSRRILPHHVTVRRSVPVTSLPRTLFDLAARTPSKRLDRAVEAALRTRWCTVASLHRVLYDLGGRGRPGTARMREVLDARGVGYVPTESELDLVGRALLSGVDDIEWQVEMSDEQGYIRRVDGLHRPSGLVIEWDGAAFHSSPSQRALDRDGDRRLAAIGCPVARYGWHDVTRDGDRVLAEVLDATAERRADAA